MRMDSRRVSSVVRPPSTGNASIQPVGRIRLREFRSCLGLSQAELARRLPRYRSQSPWSEFTVAKVEKGEREPGAELIAAIEAITAAHSNDVRVRDAGLRPITLWDWI